MQDSISNITEGVPWWDDIDSDIHNDELGLARLGTRDTSVMQDSVSNITEGIPSWNDSDSDEHSDELGFGGLVLGDTAERQDLQVQEFGDWIERRADDWHLAYQLEESVDNDSGGDDATLPFLNAQVIPDIGDFVEDDDDDFLGIPDTAHTEILKLVMGSHAVVPVPFDNENNPADTSGNIFKRAMCRAISENEPIEVIQSMLEETPDWLARHGELYSVVQHALIVNAGSPILKLLIEHDPKCTQQSFRDVQLLHVACIRNAPLDIIQLLLKLNPDAIRATDPDGMLPLHYACSSPTVSLDILKLLLKKSPHSIQSRDYKRQQVPLHVACLNDASPETVLFLIDKEPALVTEMDGSGRLPMHCACMDRNHDEHVYEEGTVGILEVVSLLFESYPQSLSVVDSLGCLPLHYASEVNAEIVQYLLRMYPGGIYQDDEDGLLPLHMACSDLRGTVQFHCIRELVDTDLYTVLSKSNDGSTPLQLAVNNVNNRVRMEIRTFLIGKQDEAIQAIREAFSMKMDELPFPDLVIAEIWKFARPDMWQPPEEDLDPPVWDVLFRVG